MHGECDDHVPAWQESAISRMAHLALHVSAWRDLASKNWLLVAHDTSSV
jgi:hypothetical protein